MHTDHTARVVAVQGAGGGAGATTLASAIGMRASCRRITTCLVDLDDLAGGLDVVLGIETSPGLRWHDLVGTDGEILGASVRERLPVAGDDGPAVLSHGRMQCPLGDDLVERTVRALAAHFELVVLDVPRSRSPLALPTDDLLVVVRGTVPAVAAAGRLCDIEDAHRGQAVDGHGRGDPDDSAHPVGRLVVRDASRRRARLIARELRRPVALHLRRDRSIDADLEHGMAPGTRRRSAIARGAEELLRAIAVRQAA